MLCSNALSISTKDYRTLAHILAQALAVSSGKFAADQRAEEGWSFDILG
jgi:hypothetical protein